MVKQVHILYDSECLIDCLFYPLREDGHLTMQAALSLSDQSPGVSTAGGGSEPPV